MSSLCSKHQHESKSCNICKMVIDLNRVQLEQKELNDFIGELNNSPVALCNQAAVALREKDNLVNELEIEIGKLKCVIQDLNGTIAKDTCGMCNWLERGDCHNQKVKLRKEIEYLDKKINSAMKCHPRAVATLLLEAVTREHLEDD